MNSREIKEIILNSTGNYCDIYEGLKNNFNETITGIYNTLYVMLKDYNKNKNKIDDIINILDGMNLFRKNSCLMHVINCSINLNTNIVKNYSVKDRIAIREVITKLDLIVNKINFYMKYDSSSKNVEFLEKLIFNGRDIDSIKLFIDSDKNLLCYRNKDGNDIFSILLMKYVWCINEEEMDYYYKVMMLFIRSNSFYESIYFSRYNQILKDNLDKQHVRDIYNVINGSYGLVNDFQDVYGINEKFSLPVLMESSKFKTCVDDRIMFTEQECITIDGVDSLCLDDAIYMEENEDGTYTLYIHIVDVASIVPYYSFTNEEARRRGETLYLSDRNINMYPECLSYDYCSLIFGKKRNTISYVVDLDSDMNVIMDSFVILKGSIINKHRLSYDEVDNKLANLGDEPLDRMLGNLARFAYKQRVNNPDKDKYRIYKETVYGDKVKSKNKNSNCLCNASSIVEEVMVLANYLVSKEFSLKGLPYIYRTFTMPDEDYLENKIKEIVVNGDDFSCNKDLMINFRNSLVKAKYSCLALPHDGVKLMSYSHSSSPARRYCDSYCQYIIHDLMFSGRNDDRHIYMWEDRNNMLVRYLNEKKINNALFTNQYNYCKAKKRLKKNEEVIG